MPREKEVGSRRFPSHLLRWTEVIADEMEPRLDRHEVDAFMIGTGCRVLLSFPHIDEVRDWRRPILRHGSTDDARWVKTFLFEPEGPDGYEHATFYVTQAERSAVNSVIEVLRMQAGTITALAIEIVLKDFVEVLPADVRKRMNDEIEKFKAAIAERARKSKRLGMELCEANGIKPVTR